MPDLEPIDPELPELLDVEYSSDNAGPDSDSENNSSLQWEALFSTHAKVLIKKLMSDLALTPENSLMFIKLVQQSSHTIEAITQHGTVSPSQQEEGIVVNPLISWHISILLS
ncbi:hypothetical protein DXG01_011183 [Tephrocybe rancida]|nr:hypothetical protein DXG01_011183 [Tephrocybe rancida]